MPLTLSDTPVKLSLAWNQYLPRQIRTITNSAGNTLLTMAGTHGVTGTPSIVVKRNSVSGYNTTHTVTSVPSTTTIKTNQSYTSDGVGGVKS